MTIKKIVIKNYKLLRDVSIDLNSGINIFVGDNDAGKSTILEALSILTTGKLNGYAFERQLKANLFNNGVRADYKSSIMSGKYVIPPQIIFEAYFDDDAQYKGTQNTLSQDTAGINITVDISSSNAATYRSMLSNKNIHDIPVELYSVSCHYFSGDPVTFRYSPFKSVFIDTTKKEYTGLLDHFVSDSIAEILTPEELTDIAVAYNNSRRTFQNEVIVQKLNSNIKDNSIVQGKQVLLCLREDENDAWRRQLSIVVDAIPFENLGLGTQNSIKTELALRNADSQANIVLMEEPENNLSFTNMAKLIAQVLKSKGKQVFISTHSSYISNKLDLANLFLVNNGNAFPFSHLSDDTKKYFIKLPGYDTLRFILATNVVLVEGPTDDLIIQRAYLDQYGHLPVDDGIDIFSVDSLAFKRFCEIAKVVGKKVVIVTDNDGDIEENIRKKYKDYYGLDNFVFFYEANEKLHTIEPSVLAVNCEKDGEPTSNFKEVLSVNGSLSGRDYNGILTFMQSNKSEWAYRVFTSAEKINYPRYIQDVIKHFEQRG